jgi:L-threonylcarbamoyladenylate synthase
MFCPFFMFGFRSFPMPARILKTDTQENLQIAIKEAKDVILTRGLVAIPTESFYALAVNVTDEKAIHRLIAAKKRLEKNPILILIPSIDAVNDYVDSVPVVAAKLMKQFWPGGLTLVFEARASVSSLLTAGTGKIGVRLSSHFLPTELARLAGTAITGTSANLSGQPACKTSREVMGTIGDAVDLVLDGGETQGGKGSTVLDVTVDPPLILREGMVRRDALMRFFRSGNDPIA